MSEQPNESQALTLLSAKRLLELRASSFKKLLKRRAIAEINAEYAFHQRALPEPEPVGTKKDEVREKLVRTGVQRRNDEFLYLVDSEGHVACMPRAGGVWRVVAEAGVKREQGWLYFVDEDGDVARMKHQSSPAAFSSEKRMLSIPRGTTVDVESRSGVAVARYETHREISDEECMVLSIWLDGEGVTWVDQADLHPAWDSMTMVLPSSRTAQRRIFERLGLRVPAGADVWALALHCPRGLSTPGAGSPSP